MKKKLVKKNFGGASSDKPWGEMTAKERVAYLDKKEATKKEAATERAKNYVKTSMSTPIVTKPKIDYKPKMKTGGSVKSKKR